MALVNAEKLCRLVKFCAATGRAGITHRPATSAPKMNKLPLDVFMGCILRREGMQRKLAGDEK